MNEDLSEIEIQRDVFREKLTQQMISDENNQFIKQIHQWEKKSIENIQQTTNDCRQGIVQTENEYFHRIDNKLTDLTKQLKYVWQENDVNQTDLKDLRQKLSILIEELEKPLDIRIRFTSTIFIEKISIYLPFSLENNSNSALITNTTKWRLFGIRVVEGNGEGNQLNQLHAATYLCIDDDLSLYVSGWQNHRIVKWLQNAQQGTVVAGGQGQGNSWAQLNHPQGILLDRFGNLYIADSRNHRIVRWRKESNVDTVLLGGNGQGQTQNQFDRLFGLAFDRNGQLHVADYQNHRIQKFQIN